MNRLSSTRKNKGEDHEWENEQRLAARIEMA